MRREFPRASSCLYGEDPVVPYNVGYNGKDYGKYTVGACVSDEANQSGTVQ